MTAPIIDLRSDTVTTRAVGGGEPRSTSAISWSVFAQARQVSLSGDGRRVAVNVDYGAIVFDTASGNVVLRVGDHREPVTRVALSPDGRRLATSAAAGLIRVWDLPQ